LGPIDKSSTSHLTMLLPILLGYGLVCYNFRTDDAVGKLSVCLLISRLYSPVGFELSSSENIFPLSLQKWLIFPLFHIIIWPLWWQEILAHKTKMLFINTQCTVGESRKEYSMHQIRYTIELSFDFGSLTAINCDSHLQCL
jgi:hypothetical protein